jgi:hypothetical protein
MRYFLLTYLLGDIVRVAPNEVSSYNISLHFPYKARLGHSPLTAPFRKPRCVPRYLP